MKTKAISKYNVAVTVQSGKVGNVRYVQKGGQTYVRSAHNQSVNNPRTKAQMLRRLKFASLAALYKEFAAVDLLRRAFPRKESNQSDYNAFMQINKSLGCYFTKEQTAAGACCALPVVVSNGSLPQITAVRVNNNLYSTISVGDLAYVAASTTVAEVSQAIISNNRAFKNGDTVTVIMLWQESEQLDNMVYPWIELDYDQFILDTKSAVKFHTAYPRFTINDGMLVREDFDAEGCFGFVHSSGDKISKCRLVDENPIREQFETEEAFAEASASYGTSKSAILYNTTAESNSNTTEVLATPSVVGETPFVTSTQVTMAHVDSEAAIRYTTDGSMPTQSSQQYSQPVTITETTTIIARAFKDGAVSAPVSRQFVKSSGNPGSDMD